MICQFDSFEVPGSSVRTSFPAEKHPPAMSMKTSWLFFPMNHLSDLPSKLYQTVKSTNLKPQLPDTSRYFQLTDGLSPSAGRRSSSSVRGDHPPTSPWTVDDASPDAPGDGEVPAGRDPWARPLPGEDPQAPRRNVS